MALWVPADCVQSTVSWYARSALDFGAAFSLSFKLLLLVGGSPTKSMLGRPIVLCSEFMFQRLLTVCDNPLLTDLPGCSVLLLLGLVLRMLDNEFGSK